MPLVASSSRAAFSHNVAKEKQSGAPLKQALAIAYSVQRKAKRERK